MRMRGAMKLSARAADLAPRLLDNAAQVDCDGRFPTQEFAWLQQQGLLNSGVVQLPAAEILEILWHVGRGNLAVGRLYEGHINALQLISWFGDQKQRERLFADADDGNLFAVWNTQAGDGVVLNQSENGWQMSGAKTFCSGAGHVTRPIVTGSLNSSGWQMVCLPVEEAVLEIDSSWWQPMGMRASASFKTNFSGSFVSSNDFIGKSDDYYSQPAFSGGAIRFCAVQLGGAAAIFDETRRFLREVGRAEDPFQESRIGQMAMRIQSGRQWLKNAAEMWESLGESPLKVGDTTAKRMVAFAAMMRIATEEICEAVMQFAERSVGARGLMRTEPFERMIRDLTMYLKQPHLDEIPGRVGKFTLESELESYSLWQSTETEILNATE
ncbi:acyl-CoA dehydrogenase [bacterium]|nr:MAG: acyl-CoA dehydrogenase [bacterium]